MSAQVKKSGEEIQSKGRLYYAFRIVGIFFKVFLAGLAGFFASGTEIHERERRNRFIRGISGRDPYKPSPYDE